MSLLDCSRDFFDFGGVTYLNCAYQGPLPRLAVAAAQEALELKTRPHRISEEDYFDVPDAFRRAVGELVGCDPADVAVTDSTTHGMMLLVNGLDWRPGDEVVVPAGEFPANRFPWRLLERRGVRVREIEVPPGAAGLERVAAAIGGRTRVVSLAWVRYQTGERRDVRAIGELCRDRGVLFAIDGSQGIGGLAFDLRETPCDLLACSAYKWMLGPYGLGFAYVSPRIGEGLKLANVNWFAVRGARDFNRLSECELELEPGARRFDVNETASFVNLAAGTASARYLAEIGAGRAEEHVGALLERLVGGLPGAFRPLADPGSGSASNILCLAGAGGGESDELVAAAHRHLVELGVSVSRREGTLRVSPFVYNTEGDVDRLLAGLEWAAGGRRTAVPPPALPVGPRVATAAAAVPERRPLAGRWITLLPLDPVRDAADLYAASHGDEVKEALWTYMPYGPFDGEAAMGRWLEGCAESSDPLFFAVVDNATAKRVGMVSFLAIEPGHRTLELGHIWYAPGHQRTRANTEAVRLMLGEAFDRWGYRRVEWKCDRLNRRSRAAALRLGFRFEGVFRQHRIVKGRNRDTAWYAMLEVEWPAVKSRLDAWLAAEDPAASPAARAPRRGG